MEPWILLTLVGVLIQSSRTVLQKNLIGRLSVGGATYARFLYGLPVAWLVVAVAFGFSARALPQANPTFLAYALIGGLGQMLGNMLFIHLIRASNFTVITTYIKTETVIGALFSFLVLGDTLSAWGFAGVLITLLGVMVLSAGKGALTLRSLAASLASRETLYGVGVGALYAAASTSYRGAILSLGMDDLVLASLFAVAWVTLLQTVIMGIWLHLKQPAVLRETIRAWRPAAWVGITGVSASAVWYVAFSMQVTAYVLAVGQVELVLAYLTSRFLFKESTKVGEIAGILVTIAGILTVVVGR